VYKFWSFSDKYPKPLEDVEQNNKDAKAMVDSVVIRGRTLIYCENLPERIY
jgi:hypothetical protein